MSFDDAWPFSDAPNVTTITLRQVIVDRQPILLVTHDSDDGCWQFLTGGDFIVSDGRVVGLGCMLKHDPSIAELADLPLGWRAWRDRVGDPWTRARKPDEDERPGS